MNWKWHGLLILSLAFKYDDNMPYKTLLLDLPSIYYRAFYALPESIVDTTGTPANAIRGSLSIISSIGAKFRINQIIAALDADWRPDWRVKLIPEYKTHRVLTSSISSEEIETPDSLTPQIPNLIEILSLLKVSMVSKTNYEADDCLASLSTDFQNCLIVTGDKDLLQLIRKKNVSVYLLSDKENPIWDHARFVSHFKIKPEQYLEYSVLRGDPSDGLPGVSKVGQKTALKLIQEHGSIENLLKHLSSIDQDKLPVNQKNILASQAYLKNAMKVSTAVDHLKLSIKSKKQNQKKLDSLASFFRIQQQVLQFQSHFHL
jgi:5'-3' exonuclease